MGVVNPFKVVRECTLNTAGGGTKNLGKIYPAYLVIPLKRGLVISHASLDFAEEKEK